MGSRKSVIKQSSSPGCHHGLRVEFADFGPAAAARAVWGQIRNRSSHGCGNASRSFTNSSTLGWFKMEACEMTQTQPSPKWKMEQHSKNSCGGFRNCRMTGFSAVMR